MDRVRVFPAGVFPADDSDPHRFLYALVSPYPLGAPGRADHRFYRWHVSADALRVPGKGLADQPGPGGEDSPFFSVPPAFGRQRPVFENPHSTAQSDCRVQRHALFHQPVCAFSG